MKRILLSFALTLVACTGMAMAQGDYPKFEVFGGYSYFHPEAGDGANGFAISLAGNVNEWFGLATDMSFHFDHGPGVDVDIYHYMFGPRWTYRKSRVEPFAHVMLGAQTLKTSFSGLSFSTSEFALQLGGGLDAKVSDNFAVRLLQADYIRSFGNLDINSYRLSAGVVLRFGQ